MRSIDLLSRLEACSILSFRPRAYLSSLLDAVGHEWMTYGYANLQTDDISRIITKYQVVKIDVV